MPGHRLLSVISKSRGRGLRELGMGHGTPSFIKATLRTVTKLRGISASSKWHTSIYFTWLSTRLAFLNHILNSKLLCECYYVNCFVLDSFAEDLSPCSSFPGKKKKKTTTGRSHLRMPVFWEPGPFPSEKLFQVQQVSRTEDDLAASKA